MAWLVIAVGIVLRLVIYFQNRNLIIDEANIVRNLFERGFIGLLKPLNYEQYAPPFFLWVEKLSAIIGGYGEKVLKSFPLLCGCGMLVLLYDILKRLIDKNLAWLPLALVAFSPYFIEFSATIKQYISDSFIVLFLLWLALRIDIFTAPRKKFFIYWSIAGIAAILFSMPSVFMLTAVGLYYAWLCFIEKKWDYTMLLLGLAGVWMAAFAVYFFTILRPQINSSYLQSYHFDYFLYGMPKNSEEWQHNWTRIKELINNATGYGMYNYKAAFLLLPFALIYLFIKRFHLFLLITVPVFITLLAAALNQFSLIMRVSLFLLPLLVLLFAIGLDVFWRIRFPVFKIAILILGYIMINSFNAFNWFHERLGFHEITEGMDYLKSKNVKGDQLFVHAASTPTYIYYTGIQPDHQKYESLCGAHLMSWDSNYTAVTNNVKDTVYFLYTGGFPEEEKQKRTHQIETNLQQVFYFEKYVCFVYGYAPKTDSTQVIH